MTKTAYKKLFDIVNGNKYKVFYQYDKKTKIPVSDVSLYKKNVIELSTDDNEKLLVNFADFNLMDVTFYEKGTSNV